MPVTLQKIKERTKTVSIDIDGEKLSVTVRPDRITPGELVEAQERAQAAEESGDPRVAMLDFCNFLCEILVSWDLKWSDEGEIVPIEPEVLLESVPFSFLTEVVEKTGSVLQVGKPKRQT